MINKHKHKHKLSRARVVEAGRNHVWATWAWITKGDVIVSELDRVYSDRVARDDIPYHLVLPSHTVFTNDE